MSLEKSNLPSPSVELLEELDDLIKRDQMLTIWNKIQELKPLAQWECGEPRRKAAIIASRLGNRRLADVLDYLNYRSDRDNPKWALYYQFRRVSHATQPVVIKTIDAILAKHREGMEPELLADYLVYQAWLLASLRDFDRANALIEEAKLVAPEYAWVYVEESDILEKQDRYEEANEVVDHALKLHPEYHAAILRKEMALIQLNRDDEAIALLLEANEKAEHGIYGMRLQYRFSERDEHEKVLWALDEHEKYSPLLGKKDKEWLSGRRGDCHYIAGDLEKTLECYQKSEHPFYKELCKNLEENKDKACTRKKLDVPFVRQHEMTCAPATLASLSKFFGIEKDHLEIADAICYDGTPWHKERTWAEENGFAVYEFRFTEEVTKKLIDRNLPFTLSTHAVTSAHLQACIGYDDRLGLAIIRDPTHRHYGEMLFDRLIKNHPVFGPRGMLIVPENQRDQVDGVNFPDQQLYDCRHQLMLAIDAHDELKMQEAITTMKVINTEHPLAIDSEIRLEFYRNNRARVNLLYKELHERFPEDEGIEYDYFYSSLSQCGRSEQLDLGLKAVAKKHPDPVFYAELGDLYLEDLRELDIAEFYLKKAARHTFSNARSMASLALCAFRKNDLQDATDYRRYAACQSPGWEGYAYQYFQLSMEADRVDEAIAFLTARTKNQGKKQSAPWITLSRAYEEINDDTAAREVVTRALELFPEDGDLLVHMAMSSYAWGYGAQAEEYLDKAKAHLSEVDWHNACGKLARNKGDRQKALRHFKRVTEIDSSHYGGTRIYCDLLEEEYGTAHVLEYLENLLVENKNSTQLLELYATKLAEFSDDRAQGALQKLLDLEPNNLWAMRELALSYETDSELEKAIALAEMCVEIQPNNCQSRGVLGGIYARNDRPEEAIEQFKKSILLEADYTYAIGSWLDLLESKAEKLEALEFYKNQLDVQPVEGGSISEYRELAYRYVEPDELLEQVRGCRQKRSGEWAAWSAEKDQLLDMGRLEEAEKLMLEAGEKFPYIPRIYVEQASVYRAMGDTQKSISCLEKSLELSPSWDWVARQLADAYELQGDVAKAESVLREAIYWAPLNPANSGCLADLLDRIGKKEEAFDIVAETLKKSPLYVWGWRELARWSVDLGRQDEVLALLELHHKTRSELKSWWEVCFDVYDFIDENEKALEYCEACLEKDPKCADMYDSKAYLLARLGQVEEAIATTVPEIYGGDIPPLLIARRALILYAHKGAKEGIELMEKLTQSHPEFLPAPRNLTDWYLRMGNYVSAKKYAMQWARLEPQSHMVYGNLGTISEQLNNVKEAAEYFEKAFQMNPEYAYAGYRAFELSLESKQFDKIPQIIQLTGHFGRYTEALEMEVRYQHAQGNTEQAFAVFQELIQQEDLLIEEVGKATELFPKEGVKLVKQLVDSGQAKSKPLLQVWLWDRRNFPAWPEKITQLPYAKEMKYPLWRDMMHYLLEKNAEFEMVRKMHKKYYSQFSEDTEAWALFLQCCARFYVHETGVSVFADVDRHENVEDWMLTNGAYCNIAVNGLLESESIIDRGLQLRSENGANHLLSMKAIIEASRGHLEQAEKCLASRDEDMDIGAQRLGCLAKKMIACMSDDVERQKLYWNHFKELDEDWKIKLYNDKILSHCRQCAKQTGHKWVGQSSIARWADHNSSILWILLAIGLLVFALN